MWDGLFLGGVELLMRHSQPNAIVALHSLTSLNALHYAARTTGDAELRQFLTLQAASFVPLFREAMKARGKVDDARVDELTPQIDNRDIEVGMVFSTLTRDRTEAARLALALLQAPGGAKELADEARRLIFLKGTDSHDYKFSSAVLEDAALLSPAVRDRFLAASLFWLKGSGAPDSGTVKRTRAALA